METWPLANRHPDFIGLGCHLSIKVVQKWFHVQRDKDPLHCSRWSGFGPAHSPWPGCRGFCFHSLCSRFGTGKEEKKAAEPESKELRSKEFVSPKEGESRWFSHVPCRHRQPCGLNSRVSSSGLRMRPGQARKNP